MSLLRYGNLWGDWFIQVGPVGRPVVEASLAKEITVRIPDRDARTPLLTTLRGVGAIVTIPPGDFVQYQVNVRIDTLLPGDYLSQAFKGADYLVRITYRPKRISLSKLLTFPMLWQSVYSNAVRVKVMPD